MRNPATSLFAPAVAQDATSTAALAEQVSVDAAESLLTRQKPDGHLLFELEADATISAEYILMGSSVFSSSRSFRVRIPVTDAAR